MIISKITNMIDNSTRILYYDKNIKSFCGIKIARDGKVTEDKTIIKDILNLIRVNDKCKFIGYENGYDVYLNPITNYKHYLKNGKEDLYMFYLNNGIDATCYSEDNKDENKEVEKNKYDLKYLCKRFFCFFVVYEMLWWPLYIANHLEKINMTNEEFLCLVGNKIEYRLSNFINKDLNDEKISAKEANDLIRNSVYLDQKTKDYLVNEQLFEDLMPYYDNSLMEYMLADKLKNLKLLEMESYNDEELGGTIVGKYIPNNPYVIRFDKKATGDRTISHEFIHFLQNSEFLYLQEACAELMNIEYYNSDYINDQRYKEGVLNLKLLMQTISEEPILKCVYGGDSSNLLEILEKNLSETEYEEFINILMFNPDSTKIDNNRLQELISILYKNIYNENMYDNLNVISEINYYTYSKTIYFNKAKKQDEYEITIPTETAYELGYIDNQRVFRKIISYDEYTKINNLKWCVIMPETSSIKINDNIVSNLDTGEIAPIKDAYEKGDITIYEYSYQNDGSFEETHYIYYLKNNDIEGKIGGLSIGDGYYGFYSFKYPSYEQRIEEAKNQKKLVK